MTIEHLMREHGIERIVRVPETRSENNGNHS